MMIRRIKQTCLGVLLIVAALLTACSSEDKAQPDAASREQPKTWKLCVQANKIDSTTTRGLYLDGSVLKSKWGDPSTSTGQTVEVWRGDTHLGNLTASASNNGSTVITGELTGTFTKDETLTLYSPSKTRDYSGQTGTIESMSAKDYVSAEITVTAVDGSSGVLATSDAAFERLQSFNKFTVTPAVHSLQIAAEGMATVTATLAGTADGTEFYVALPNTGGSTKSFTFTGTPYAGIPYECSKSKQLVDGNYYTGSMDLMVVVTPVDLGLPSGVKWANMNIGATSETDYGLYFAWGETTGYEGSDSSRDFKWANTPYYTGNGSTHTWSKYTGSDGKTVLESTDDAAAVNWGGSWRMPTATEITELLNNTNQELVANYNSTGVAGYKFTNKTDASKYIFLPATGFLDGTVLFEAGAGYYWSSSHFPSNASYGRDDSYGQFLYLYSYAFYSGSIRLNLGNLSHGERGCGYPVRPVQGN